MSPTYKLIEEAFDTLKGLDPSNPADQLMGRLLLEKIKASIEDVDDPREMVAGIAKTLEFAQHLVKKMSQ